MMGCRRRAAFLLTVILAAGLGLPAGAAELPDGTFTLQFENDKFSGTDRHYTHGSRIAFVSDKATDGPDWAKDILERLYPLADLRAGRAGLAFGQNMYTPEDTSSRQTVANDRPYAGWLYAGISVHAETEQRIGAMALDTLDSVELDIGVVGPLSLAENVQSGFHDLISVPRAKGWDNQLENEPGIVLIFERKLRPEPLRLGEIETDMIPHAGAALGNVFTLATAGAILRFGQNLDVDYGPPLIRPSLSGLDAVEQGADLAWYLFVGAQGRYVARNIFLDGNSFERSHRVDKRPWVGDAQFGVAAVINGVRIALTQVLRTREFYGQNQADRYGALSLSARF